MSQPYFSIVIPVYNRETYIRGCIDSCLNQSFSDFEIVVVDDGSSDNTLHVITQISDPRIRIIKHQENRGINAARYSGRSNSIGKWIVNLDSDWELFPISLQRLFELTCSLDRSIIGVRARQILDTGFISPPFIPKKPIIDYIGRIKYMEIGGGYDVLGCYRREVFERVITYPDRKGGSGTVFLEVLNLHQQGLMLHVEDVLCKQYTDAPNSVTRGNVKTRVKNLKKSAPDMLWMYEEAMRLHGEALRMYGPNQYLNLQKKIALQYFYLGKRGQGLETLMKYLRKKPFDLLTWATLCFGLVGPEIILYGNASRHLVRSIYLKRRKKSIDLKRRLSGHTPVSFR
jgi:glycosyltransferase involved in cell wall biosynthesis